MQILFKGVKIIQAQSEWHLQQVDLYVEDGNIKSIAKHIKPTANMQVIVAEDLHVSAGWFDVGTQVGDPGFEHRETIESANAAATFGGYTALAVMPNTIPVSHSKTEILYLKKQSEDCVVHFYPLGAISQNVKGQEISEMYDMNRAGAIGFTDGKYSLAHTGLMLRALEYVQPFDGLVLNHPNDALLSEQGQMHEGVMSTSLGMKGIPSIAEEMMLQRDIYLTEYSNGRYHAHNISTERSVQLVRDAKKRGLKVTASVAALNLILTDDSLVDFDSNLKVNPPLRSASDIKALKKGLRDGTIDFISSNHVPLDEESKNLEFPYASFGAIGLETTFALTNTFSGLDLETIVEKLADSPRRIMRTPDATISVGAAANLTFFQPNLKWAFSSKDINSKSKNTSWVGTSLVGKAFAIINKGRFERV